MECMIEIKPADMHMNFTRDVDRIARTGRQRDGKQEPLRQLLKQPLKIKKYYHKAGR